MFSHLGGNATYYPTSGDKKEIVAFVKEPENLYDLGVNDIADEVASILVKSEEITPRIGEQIEFNGRLYRIYNEPLLDASNFMWKFLGVLVKGAKNGSKKR